MREIIFDTETTGFDPLSGDRMVEIGCIEMVGRVMTGNTFHAYFNPERAMPSAAEQVHGLSDRFLSDKPLFAHKVEELLEFIGDSPLVAHNASFDFGFLNNELERCGQALVSMERMIDTVALARVRHPGAKLSLDALCTRYGIDRSHRVKHGALLDAELLAHLYIELTGGRQIGLGLAPEVDTDTVAAAAAAKAVEREYRAPRPHVASTEELERHAAFIEAIPDALWNDRGAAN
jgi:DNA polymerase-3 subunit epsilon